MGAVDESGEEEEELWDGRMEEYITIVTSKYNYNTQKVELIWKVECCGF